MGYGDPVWQSQAGSGVTLQNYITDIQRLLHDSTNRFWGGPKDPNELIDYVNKARKVVSVETGCTRQIIPLDITAATSLQDATYSLDNLEASRRVVDVLDILLNYNNGNTTFPLRFLPFPMMIRTALWQYQSTGTPTYYTINNRQMFILQWPAIDYLASNVDCLLEPLDLVALTDVDNDLAFPFTECVAFYAAYLAKIKDQRRQEAEDFFRDYLRRKAQAIGSQMSRRFINQ